jgi:hypothetical protein
MDQEHFPQFRQAIFNFTPQLVYLYDIQDKLPSNQRVSLSKQDKYSRQSRFFLLFTQQGPVSIIRAHVVTLINSESETEQVRFI